MRSKHVLFLLMTVSNIVSECVTIMHAKASLCQNDLCSSKSFQIAPFSVFFFLFFVCSSLQFQIVLNAVRMHYLASLFSKCVCNSKSFQMPSECTIHSLSLFSKFSLKSEIVSNTARMHSYASLFSKFPNCVKYRQNTPFTVLVFIFSLQFQIPSECTI